MNEGEADQGSVCHPGDSACRWCQLSLVRRDSGFTFKNEEVR